MTSRKAATLTDRVLNDFAGQWRLEKVINQADGVTARFDGHATWRAVEEGLLYRESGALHLAGSAPIRAERRYLWRAPLRVYFEDGRLFHDVPAQGGEARHLCPPDDYRVVYDFQNWPEWRATWRVFGPRKSYVMVCDYHPADAFP